MDLARIQASLKEAKLDGWLFCDFHHRDLMAYRILGLDSTHITSRRWFYFVPASGEPAKLAHRVEPRKLDSLPGKQDFYLSWRELHEKLKAMVARSKRIAMQYSPLNNIPYVSVVDAGTIELIRSFGVEVATSADLVQTFEAVIGPEGIRSHKEAATKVQAIKDEAFAYMDRALKTGKKTTEFEVKEFILERFAQEGMTSDGDSPIVGFNDHPADPHFEPTKANAHTLKAGDTILVDLWARFEKPGAIYYDITWCGFAGASPPAEYVKIFETARDGRDAALQHVRAKLAAGQACAGWEVDDACRKVVVAAGYGEFFLHRTGHSIGTSVHGNGVNIDNLETKDERFIGRGCASDRARIYPRGAWCAADDASFAGRKAEVAGPSQSSLVLG
jgi:Xaa-Pro aminopeptidase